MVLCSVEYFMDMAAVNRALNKRVVRITAMTAMIFRVLFAAKLLSARRRMVFWFFTRSMLLTVLCDASVLDSDDAIGHLGDFFVVGDHYDGLVETLTGDF